jgi:hypothetical protein
MAYYIISPRNSYEYPNQFDIISIKLQDYIKVIEYVEMFGTITVECSYENLYKLQEFTNEIKFSCNETDHLLGEEPSKKQSKKINTKEVIKAKAKKPNVKKESTKITPVKKPPANKIPKKKYKRQQVK